MFSRRPTPSRRICFGMSSRFITPVGLLLMPLAITLSLVSHGGEEGTAETQMTQRRAEKRESESSCERRDGPARPGSLPAELPGGAEVRPGETSVAPLFTQTQPAQNPARLRLIVDPDKVLGWISGTADRTGEEVLVEHGGRLESVIVQPGNTFTWRYDVEDDSLVEFRAGELREAVMLRPRPTAPPTVFFVVDRPVYRPGHTLRFVGFVRQVDAGGDSRPLARRSVEVELRSARKKTLAARMSLVSDEAGRIAGEYPFVDADPQDDYVLEARGYTGSATVALAEFRKSKVKLQIEGELTDGTGPGTAGRRLRLDFSAVDFLDEPVSSSKVHFRATVLNESEPECDGSWLNARDFVHSSKEAGFLDNLERLGESEELLLESGAGLAPDALYRGPVVLAVFEDDLVLESGTVDTTLDVDRDWIEGGCVVHVHGVLVDENGREERASIRVPLEGERSSRLRLSLPERPFGAGEPIPVATEVRDAAGRPMETTTTLVVVKLSPRGDPRGSAYFGYNGYYGSAGYGGLWNAAPWLLSSSYGWNGHRPVAALSHLSHVRRSTTWRGVRPPSPVEREVTTALSIEHGRGTLVVDEPGAYRIKAIARLPDGTQLEDETSCVILTPAVVPRLALELAAQQYRPGDRLRGEVHSSFENARVLLTVSDARGTRLWRPLDLNGSVLEVDLPLPESLDFGAVVAVEYVAEDGVVHLGTKAIQVLPQERMLDIRAKVPVVAEPGETVEIEVEVDPRGDGNEDRQDVDLIVSVYDQSLLGIAPDRSVDIRDFYLSDGRADESMPMRFLERKLQGVTVEELVERARRLLEADPHPEPGPGDLLTRLVNQSGSSHLYSVDIRTLLWLAGVRSELVPRGGWSVRLDPEQESHRVVDLLRHTGNDWRLTFGLFRNVLVLAERPSNEESRPMHWPLHLPYSPYGAGYAFAARGDAHYLAGGNGAFSYLPSGQSFISHVAPVGPSPAAGGGTADAGGVIRRDFSDTAFFARARTRADGRATVRFRLPDSLTNWRVVVNAITEDGHVGRQTASFRTWRPVMVWPMLPRTFTRGDRVELYASVHNRTGREQLMTVSIDVEGGEIHGARDKTVLVKPGSDRPVYWTFEPTTPGFCEILMSARCDAGSDASLKRLPVSPCAIEEVITASGFAEGTKTFRIPRGVNLQESTLAISLSPTLAADMLETLPYLIEYPHGCVEQTMSRFLPTLEVAKILSLHGISRPELEEKLPGYVAAGIKRLLELQNPDGGWGWIGTSQTHEMMTPYALYGLIQAEDAGYEIGSPEAIQRGLDRLEGFIGSLGEAKAADRVYCMYVYSLRRSLRADWWTWLDSMVEEEGLSDYAAALALEITARAGDRETLADRLAQTLRARARIGNGRVHWTTAGFSRWGEDPGEITAAVLKALVRHDARHELIPGILSYFASTKRGNRWKSTKDTAMILFAMCDYLAHLERRPLEESSSVLEINGSLKRAVRFDDRLAKRIAIPGNELHHGDNQVRFLSDLPGVLYRLVFRFRREGEDIEPASHGLTVTRRFWLLGESRGRVRELTSGDTVPRGAYIASEVRAHHGLNEPMRYLLVTNPRPAGCEVLPQNDTRFRQSATSFVLREDRTRAVLWHHEATGARLSDGCVFHAELAGDFIVPPASVELMYEPDTRGHSGSFRFRVVDESERS